MIKGGYILQPRAIKDSDIYKAPPYVREIWAYLYREANSSDAMFAGMIIRRGQLFRDYKTIRDDLSWYIGYRKESYNENQTKKAMKALREAGRITTKKELGGVLITICNYDYYQNPKNYERTNESTNESTTIEPMKNHPLPDNNKNKKNKKNNNKMLCHIFEKDIDDLNEKKYFKIAKRFYDAIMLNSKEIDVKFINLENAEYEDWVDPIRKLMEKDGYSVDDIKEAYGVLKSDPFWKKNIRNTAKLRKTNRDKSATYIQELLLKARSGGKSNASSTVKLKNKGI